MGARLVFNTSRGEQRFPGQPKNPHSNGSSDAGERTRDTSAVPQFGLLGLSAEERKRRRRVLLITPVFEAVAIAIIFWALMSLPPNPVTKTVKEEVLYFRTPTPPAPIQQHPRLLERPISPRAIASAPVLPRLPQQQVQKPVAENLKMPRIPHPKVELPEVPPAPKPVEHFAAAEAARPKPRQTAMVRTGDFNPDSMAQKMVKHPLHEVRTGNFNPGSMAKGTVKRPLREVQTGGFGADNGVPNNPAPDSNMKVAQLGSFDLPSGPGQGNGTGGAHGIRGTVASAGFGNGIGEASGGRPAGAASQSVHQGGFGSVVAGKKASHSMSGAQTSAYKPVIILSKPNPVYPPEARRKHIEGQVILSVLFNASGNLKVLKVEKGLGYDMDAAAIQAAEKIKFKPAEKDGRPVNSTATVHIIFQLAY